MKETNLPVRCSNGEVIFLNSDNCKLFQYVRISFFLLVLFCFVLCFYFSDYLQEDAVFKLYVMLHYCITFFFYLQHFLYTFSPEFTPVLNGVHVARFVIFFSFGHYVVCRSLNVFWLLLSYLQTLFSDCYTIVRMYLLQMKSENHTTI